MGVQVSWGNDDKTIVHYHFDNNWTWDEFFPAKAQAYAMIEAVNHKVGVILETQHDGVIPPNLLINGRNALRNKHPNATIIVIVVTRPFIRTMIGTVRAFSPLSQVHLELAFTLDEARQRVLDYLQITQDNVRQSEY